MPTDDPPIKQSDAEAMEQDTGVLGFILLNAVKNRVSDIHIDPKPDSITVRFRIDGLLYLFQNFQRNSQEDLVSRIKVMAKLDVAERRLPQDGHFTFVHDDKNYNFRVSTVPTSYGEAAVLRILNREETFKELEDIGLDRDQLLSVQKMISSPSGMILTTGPTGSGKTTLLYSILHKLNQPTKNLTTIEDPIELQIPSIRQTQINETIGLDFARVLRSSLRQDPDVIMIGEIRDKETAQMAVQAALSGILVLSTFHTFDIPALVGRLSEMDITSSIVAQSIKGVISTRLARTLCPHCKVKHRLTQEEEILLKEYPIPKEAQDNFMEGKGCDKCNRMGFLGRTGIFEVVYFDEDIKSAIISRKPPSEIYDLLRTKMFKSLKYCAIEKVYLGMTTFAEVIRTVGL